jgi:hypothetical protein
MLNLCAGKFHVQLSVCFMCVQVKNAGFGCNLHLLKNSSSLWRSASGFVSHSANELAWKVNAISSAYWNYFDTVIGMSDMYRLNSIGAKTLPWGDAICWICHKEILESNGSTACCWEVWILWNMVPHDCQIWFCTFIQIKISINISKIKDNLNIFGVYKTSLQTFCFSNIEECVIVKVSETSYQYFAGNFLSHKNII